MFERIELFSSTYIFTKIILITKKDIALFFVFGIGLILKLKNGVVVSVIYNVQVSYIQAVNLAYLSKYYILVCFVTYTMHVNVVLL